jgi:hypothetical protein
MKRVGKSGEQSCVNCFPSQQASLSGHLKNLQLPVSQELPRCGRQDVDQVLSHGEEMNLFAFGGREFLGQRMVDIRIETFPFD